MPLAPARIVVNLKVYAAASGPGAVAIAKAARRVAARTGVAIAVAPQALDVRLVSAVGGPVYAQHADALAGESHTGWSPMPALKAAGVSGTLLNHSEHRLSPAVLSACVEAARRHRLVSVVCSQDDRESAKLARLRPTAVAVEPPGLIGGDVSVTTADPAVVRRSVEAVRAQAPRVRVLCGAGVKTGRDVARAVELGAWGVLLASGVTKARNPARVLEDLARAFP